MMKKTHKTHKVRQIHAAVRAHGHTLTPKKVTALVIIVALAVLFSEWCTSSPHAQYPQIHPDDAQIKVAMKNYLFGYSLARSGFIPALSTSTPACSGPLALNASANGNLVVFGHSCEHPSMLLCQEMNITPAGPQMSAVSILPNSADANSRTSCQ